MRAAALAALDARLARAFPDVPLVEPEALAAALVGPHPPLLLDARSADEHAISHLPGTVRVDPDADPSAWRLAVHAEAAESDAARPVVVYCSVGWRSARVAEALRARGLDARNLRGGIFRWAIEGRPLVDADGAPARRVHPYDAVWGRLLPPALRTGKRMGNGA